MQKIPGYYQNETGDYRVDQRRNQIETLAQEDRQRLGNRKYENYVKLLESRSLGKKYHAVKKDVTEEFLKNVEINNPEFVGHDIPNNRTINHLGKTNKNGLYTYCRTGEGVYTHEIFLFKREPNENGLNIRERELLSINGRLNDFQIVENEDDDEVLLIASFQQRNQANRLQLFTHLNDISIYHYNQSRNCSKVKFLIDDNNNFNLFIADRRTLMLENVIRNSRVSTQLQSKSYSNVITSIEYNKHSLPCVGFQDGYVVMKDRRMPFSREAAEFYGGGPNIVKVKNIIDTDYIVCEAVENRHVVSLYDVRNTSLPVFEYLNTINTDDEKIPFVLDSTESIISLDCRPMQVAVRIFDVRKGNTIAAYPGFVQLMYEEIWPSIKKPEGLVGFRSNDRNRVEWLPVSNNL